MRAHIFDVAALRAVSPAALSGFARSEGWSKVEAFGDHADVYAGDGLPEIILPRTEQVGDYAALMSRLIGVFADVSSRDELSIYRDLIVADRDVIRVRAEGDDDGAVELEDGVAIVTHAKEMLLAAACAARNPKALYRAGANREATEYMRRVKLGQTEHGSFVITLLAPVPPLISHQPLLPGAQWVPFDDEPLERMVTRRLANSLSASRAAAEAVASGESSAFDEAVLSGVSANLCEAVAELIKRAGDLTIGITWARTRPAPEKHTRVTFSTSDSGILSEAARTFRQREPRPDVTLHATVHKLSRDHHEEHGAATLKAVIDEKLCSVGVRFDPHDFDKATHAIRDKTPLIVTGDLERVGQRWQMSRAKVHDVPNATEPDD
jgi:hypothetical protein